MNPRQLWGSRPRSQTPPPKQPSSEPMASPTLEVLAKEMQQFQELQAQAVAKGSASHASAELVKLATSTLAMLPELKGGCEPALAFQDCLEVSSSVLADVGEQSGVWWTEVMDVGKTYDKYDKWLHATPMERLGISPDGHVRVESELG